MHQIGNGHPVTKSVVVLILAVMQICIGAELQKISGCTLVPTEWGDGDSFEIRLPDGKHQTIRLYGADCIEMHVEGDESNARRLRDQRRHFGITDILTAKSMGEQAKVETLRQLAKPFTIHSIFADARGDGRFSRVYAFVELADGEDLSELLVSKGLARAFGVVRQRPDGTSGSEWRDHLADLELIAARASHGAWEKTDWAKLALIRKEARDESAEIQIARGQNAADEANPINPNTAARDALMTIPGVGEKTANAIIEARPFKQLSDLMKVPGIGQSSFRKIQPYLTIESP